MVRASTSLRFLLVLLFVKFCCSADDEESDEINKVDVSSEKPLKELRLNLNLTSINATKAVVPSLICPSKLSRVPFFTLPCKAAQDCSVLGSIFLCCYGNCLRGVQPRKPEPQHAPWLGIIERVCPEDPMPEIMSVQECTVDADCGARICCAERGLTGFRTKRYCRNGAPRFNRMPAVRQALLPLKRFTVYLQCTPPPPPIFDIFPRPCKSPFDCFPNLCCQENGKKVCRPPKKSMLSLIAGAASRLGTSSIARNFIQRIS